MEEWKEYKIGDLCKKVCSGGTPKSTVASYYNGDIPWLNTKEVSFNRIYQTEKNITQEGLDNSSAKWIEKNAVIVAMYGATAGKCAITKIPLTTNQACCNLMIDEAKADYRYVYYALCNDYVRLASLANGGAQQNLNAQQIKDFDIPYFPLSTQQKIANILSSLDDKIEVNRRINEQLEELAGALFKSWFVDFEPFKDGNFVESELGMIPEGWKVDYLENLCDSISVKHKFDKDNLIFLNTGDIHNNIYLHSNYMPINEMPGQAKKSIKKGDILYSEIRPINRHYALVNFDANDYVVSTKLMVIRSKDIHNLRLFQYLTSNEIVEYLQQEAETRSGTFPQIRFENIQRLKMIVASPFIEEQYIKLLLPIYNKIETNNKEITHLTNLRDTLLPKLMSGEIDVNEVKI